MFNSVLNVQEILKKTYGLEKNFHSDEEDIKIESNTMNLIIMWQDTSVHNLPVIQIRSRRSGTDAVDRYSICTSFKQHDEVHMIIIEVK